MDKFYNEFYNNLQIYTTDEGKLEGEKKMEMYKQLAQESEKTHGLIYIHPDGRKWEYCYDTELWVEQETNTTPDGGDKE